MLFKRISGMLLAAIISCGIISPSLEASSNAERIHWKTALKANAIGIGTATVAGIALYLFGPLTMKAIQTVGNTSSNLEYCAKVLEASYRGISGVCATTLAAWYIKHQAECILAREDNENLEAVKAASNRGIVVAGLLAVAGYMLSGLYTLPKPQVIATAAKAVNTATQPAASEVLATVAKPVDIVTQSAASAITSSTR